VAVLKKLGFVVTCGLEEVRTCLGWRSLGAPGSAGGGSGPGWCGRWPPPHARWEPAPRARALRL